MRTIFLTLALTAAACSSQPQPDAYGNVDATEVTVGAEAAGQLMRFTASEGDVLAADATVGSIDDTQLRLEQDQATAEREAQAARVREAQQNTAALQAQRDAAVAERDAAQAQRESLAAQSTIARRALLAANALAAPS